MAVIQGPNSAPATEAMLAFPYASQFILGELERLVKQRDRLNSELAGYYTGASGDKAGLRSMIEEVEREIVAQAVALVRPVKG